MARRHRTRTRRPRDPFADLTKTTLGMTKLMGGVIVLGTTAGIAKDLLKT